MTFPNEKMLTFARFLLGRRPIKVPDHVNSFDPSFMRKKIKGNMVVLENYPFDVPFFISIGAVMAFVRWVE